LKISAGYLQVGGMLRVLVAGGCISLASTPDAIGGAFASHSREVVHHA
jgi:hypothetical protein